MSSSNELYAVGVTSSYAAPQSWWIVREYSGGASSLVDSFQYVADFSSGANAVATDVFGNVYVAGYGDDGSNKMHWLVRKFSDGSWSTIDDYNYVSANAQANVATVDAVGNLYVSGFALDSTNQAHWIVREYSGSSWTTIDDYLYTGAISAVPTGIGLDPVGNIFVVGTIYDGTNQEHWLVRESTGGTWSTIDDYQYVTGQSSQATSLAIDSLGQVYVGGIGTTASYAQHWIVRKYSSGTWDIFDDYVYQAGTNNAEANALAIDPSGKVYAAGIADDHWIVREYFP
jgi:hypothetical protein